MNATQERLALVLTCEGLGDCLFAIPVFRKLQQAYRGQYAFDLFTRQPAVFKRCPYVDTVRHIDDPALNSYPKRVRVFETEKLQHWTLDTFDFMTIPLGLGTLSFREKQLEYFPQEEDDADVFDVVLNTSMTWPTRSWSLENWQRLANALVERELKVAVVGKDVESASDKMVKRSPGLGGGVTNLVNALSLDQTYYTIKKAGLFVSGQGGLSVLAGSTDTRIIVLGMSIEWSKRAIYRNESPFHKVTYLTGTCAVHCASSDGCPLPENRGEIKCVPAYDVVEAAVLAQSMSGSPRWGQFILNAR